MRSISNTDWGNLLTGPAGNGNIVNDGTRRFVYDAFNRVKEVYKESGGVFVCDQVNSPSTRFACSGPGDRGRANPCRTRAQIRGLCLPPACRQAGFTCSTAPLLTCSVCDESHTVWGQYVDELIQQREIGDTDYYLLSDLLYRAVALTDDEAAIVETYDCDAYGNTIAYDTAGGEGWWEDDDEATSNPKCQFIFTGRRFDPETSDSNSQMYFYRARYYSPILGRFISRDPIVYDGGMNLYEYVGSRAVDAVDPRGLVITWNPVSDLIDWLFGIKRPKKPKPPKVCVKQPEYDQCLAKAKAKYDRLRKFNKDKFNELWAKVGQDVRTCIDDCNKLDPIVRQVCILGCKAGGATLKLGLIELYTVADVFTLTNFVGENTACLNRFRKKIPAGCPCPKGYKPFKEDIKTPRFILILA